MRLSRDQIIALAKTVAATYSIEPSLFLGLIEQESGFNTWASRFEPVFYDRYILKSFPTRTTESVARATSYGLCQVMGATARELGFDTASMCALCDEAIGLDIGARKLSACLKSAKGDVTAALLKYNGGSNKDYPIQVMAKQGKYKNAA